MLLRRSLPILLAGLLVVISTGGVLAQRDMPGAAPAPAQPPTTLPWLLLAGLGLLNVGGAAGYALARAAQARRRTNARLSG